MKTSFKNRYSVDERWEEAHRVINNYPDRVPIICERANTSSIDGPDIDKNKYLVPKNLSIGQFMYVIRKRLRLPPEKAIFIFVGGAIPPSSQLIADVYEYYRDYDGFLYITYSFENVFG
jgi:GABA(A) receptor-associated protein